MPEMQPSVPATPAAALLLEAPAAAFDDADYALGCECADPALQIAWWGQDGAAEGA